MTFDGTGTLVSFNNGTGFIEPDDSSERIFYHVRPPLRITARDIGRRVFFTAKPTGRSPAAVSIRFADSLDVGGRQNGTLVRFCRGYTFVATEREEFFAHVSQYPRHVSEADVGKSVSFTVSSSSKGLVATDIAFIEG